MYTKGSQIFGNPYKYATQSLSSTEVLTPICLFEGAPLNNTSFTKSHQVAAAHRQAIHLMYHNRSNNKNDNEYSQFAAAT